MITPEQLASSGSESGHQKALMCWSAQSGIPELKWLFAIPNGFYATAMQKGKMKAEGLRSGVSDIMLPVKSTIQYDWATMDTYCGLFIEMKRPLIKENGLTTQAAGKLNPDQEDFGAFVTRQGYKFVICYSWIEAKDAILQYLGKV